VADHVLTGYTDGALVENTAVVWTLLTEYARCGHFKMQSAIQLEWKT